MQSIALINQKGGTGKTTSTVNIGAGLVRLKKRVLVLDLDPQANLTYSLGVKAQEGKPAISEVLEGKATLDEAMIDQGDGLAVIPASLDLAETESKIFSMAGREYLLKEAMADLKRDFDYVLIDCPPSLGVLTLNALVAVRQVFIPFCAEVLPLQGVRGINNLIGIVKKRLNPNLALAGIIITRFDGRKSLSQEVRTTITEHFGDLVFKTAIRENVKLAETPSYGKDIFSYAPKSHGTEDYSSLCREIISMEKKA